MNAKFEGLVQTTAGIDDVLPWDYPGIGYNASDGIFYVDEDQQESLTMIPLALRQCKEVEDGNGLVHRYPIRTAKAKMITGDVTYRLQIACLVDNELYLFGARSFTARASFTNPEKGQWRYEEIEPGIWVRLMSHIKQIKADEGIQTFPGCFEFTVKPGPAITVGQGKNTSKAHPIVLDGDFVFVGAEKANENADLFDDEDLTGWIKEWNIASTEAPVFEEEQEDILEDIPF